MLDGIEELTLNLSYLIPFIWFCCKGLFKDFPVIKVGLSRSKKICVICLIESPLEMMKNDFYFILKALFVLEILEFLSRLFGYKGKTAWLEK